MRDLDTIRLLLPLLRRYRWGLPSMIVLGTLSSLAEGIGISLFVPLLQGLDPQSYSTTGAGWIQGAIDAALRYLPSSNRLEVIVVSILTMTICKAALTFSDSVVAGRINSSITHSIRSRIFSKVMEMNQAEQDQIESGRLLNLLGVDTWRTSDAIGLLVTLLVSLCSIGVFSTLLLLLSWRLALLVILGMTMVSLLLRMVSAGTRTLGRHGVEANAALSEQMLDGLHGIEVVQMFGLQTVRQRLFDAASEKVRSIYLRLELLHRAAAPIAEICYVGLLLVVLLAGMTFRNSISAVMVFLLLLYRLQPQIRQFDSARLSLIALAGSVEDTTRFLDSPMPPQYRAVSGIGTFRQDIRFEEVRFSYGAGFSFDHLSFRIPCGKTTAIVGPSGCGKTTIISLLCRFREPFGGEILVDGRPLAAMDREEWRRRIAWVGQDSYLFSTSVRENIRYGNLAASDEEVDRAAQQADADDFIRRLPNGYETKVGPAGVPLSGGQTQRLALARALLRNPSILILDEATSALDSISEDAIQRYLRPLDSSQTVIVISHRLSTVKYADYVVVLQNGRVTEQGYPADLFARRGLLSRLRELQNVE